MQEDRVGLEKTFYNDGSIKTVQEFSNDTIQQGFYKRFYKNGQLEIQIPYEDNRKNGMVREYYSNGEIKGEGKFIDGVQQGEAKWYYKEGALKAMCNYFDGVKRGKCYLYFENGDVQAYIYYNMAEGAVYRVDYGMKEMILKEKGAGFPEVIVNSSEVEVNEVFKAEIHVIDPPHGTPHLFVKNEGSVTELSLNNGVGFYETIWMKPNKYTLQFLLKMESDIVSAKKEFDFLLDIGVHSPTSPRRAPSTLREDNEAICP